MEMPRPASPACSSASSLDSNGLPIGRIKCSKDKILVGDRHYQSATDALLAYLRQFETVAGSSNGGTTAGSGASSVSSRGSSRGTAVNGPAGDVDGGCSTPRSHLSTDLKSIGVEDKKDEVQQLLTSKVSPELKEEVTDTLREIKLKNLLKKAVSKSQKPGKTGLQQEVEAALARSAQLLEKVTMEDIKSSRKTSVSDMPDSISDISLPTQLLLADVNNSINNSINHSRHNSSDSVLSQDLEDNVSGSGKRANGHVYSCRSPDYLNRSLNSGLLLSPTDILYNPHNIRLSRQRHRRHNLSHDDLTLTHPHSLPHTHHPPLPSSHSRLLSNSSTSSNSSSKLSDSLHQHNRSNLTDNLRRIRSRSVPPNPIQNDLETSRLLKESGRDLHRAGSITSISNVPSWVNDAGLNTSLGLSPETSKPAIPQWVEDVAKSDISVDTILAQHNSRLVTNNTSNTTANRLSRRDNHVLSSRENSFSKSEGDLSRWKDDDNSDNDINLSKLDASLNLSLSNSASSPLDHPQQLSEKHVTFTDSPAPVTNIPRPPNHSTPLRERGNASRQKVASLAGVNGHASSPDANNLPKTLVTGPDGSDISDMKSSSLDTLALLTGKPHTRHQGPSVVNGSSLASKMFRDGPLLSSIEQDRTGLSPPGGSSTDSNTGCVTSSDGVLDGDRSWEKHTHAFKAPVPVGNGDHRHGNESNDNAKKNSCSSLSGGNQPGSMETLKNMLFKLQKEDPSVTANDSPDPDMVSGSRSTEASQNDNPCGLPALRDYDFQTEPGGHSLEKALHHLDRLKTLVKNTASNGQGDLINGVGGGEMDTSPVTG